MSRWGKPRKNKKFIDPRYFMDEKTLQEGNVLGVKWNTPKAKEKVATLLNLLETDVDQIIKWDPVVEGDGVFVSEGTEVILDDATLWPGHGAQDSGAKRFRAVMVEHHQMPDGGTHWGDMKEYWIVKNSPSTATSEY
jgi:hypothetical protein